MLAAADIESFYAGDFRRQAIKAAEQGGCVVAFPPTYKGGYERLYKFIDANTRWQQPEYDVWNPDDLEAWTIELDQNGISYCILSDQRFEQLDPVTVYQTPSFKPIYTYSNCSGSALMHARNKSTPFKYVPVDPEKLTKKTTVQLVRAESAHMTFLKNSYLGKGIAHVTGEMNFLVFLDGMLAGGFIYTRSKFGTPECIYLLSDFSIVSARKISKLISLLATCGDVVRLFEVKHLQNVTSLVTTAFTHKPVSMKYRGVFKLSSRKPGMLNYASEVRRYSAKKIYAEWWQKYGNTNTPHQPNPERVKASR